MADYSRQAALTLRLIADKGASVIFKRDGAPVDPITQEGPSAPSSFTAYTLALPLSTAKAVAMFGASAANKRQLDVHIALSGAGYTPKAGDRFSWSGQLYKLLSDAELLDPGGTGALYAHTYAEAA